MYRRPPPGRVGPLGLLLEPGLVGGDHARHRPRPERHRGRSGALVPGGERGGQDGRRGPVGRVLGQAPGHDLPQPGRDRVQDRVRVHHPVQHGSRRPGAERPGSPGRVGDHAAQREHVAGGPGLALGLLRRHVAGRAEHHPGRGQRRPVGGPGDPEVDDPRPVHREQHVGGLEVTVHHPAGVDRLQGLDQPGQQRPQRGLGQRAVLADHLVQRRARHERGGQPGRPFVQPAGHDRRGVDPADRPGRGDLLAEAAQELGVIGQVAAHDLDGDGPAGRGQAEVDPAHAARAELGPQPVLADHPRVIRRQCLHLRSRCRVLRLPG